MISQAEKEEKAGAPKGQSDAKKQTKLGVEVAKDENYSEWYSQVTFYSLNLTVHLDMFLLLSYVVNADLLTEFLRLFVCLFVCFCRP